MFYHTLNPVKLEFYFSRGVFRYLSMCVASRARRNRGTMSGSGIYRAPKSGERFSFSWRGKVTAVTGWGMLRDGLLSPFVTSGAQKKLCVFDSEGEEWVLSTGAANLQPTIDIHSLTRQRCPRQVQVCSTVNM